MPEVERHPRQSIGVLWGVALFLSLPLRFQPQLHQAGSLRESPRRGAHAITFPQGGELFFSMKRRRRFRKRNRQRIASHARRLRR
jgi:hypothetical protein